MFVNAMIISPASDPNVGIATLQEQFGLVLASYIMSVLTSQEVKSVFWGHGCCGSSGTCPGSKLCTCLHACLQPKNNDSGIKHSPRQMNGMDSAIIPEGAF